jgi:hypothetical protein
MPATTAICGLPTASAPHAEQLAMARQPAGEWL